MTFQIKLAFDRWHTEDPTRYGVDTAEEIHLRKVYVDLFNSRDVGKYTLKRISDRDTFIPSYISKGDEITFETVKAGNMTSGRHYNVHIFFENEDDMLMAEFVLMNDYIS